MKLTDIEQIVNFQCNVDWQAWIHVEDKTGAPKFIEDTVTYGFTGPTLADAYSAALKKELELYDEINSGTPKLYPKCEYRVPDSTIIPFISISVVTLLTMEFQVFLESSEAAIINACISKYDPFGFSKITDSEVDDDREFAAKVEKRFKI